MLRFVEKSKPWKKFGKFLSKRENPTDQVPNIGAECGENSGDTNHGGGSRITTILTPGHESDDAKTAPERTSGGGQDEADAHDLVQLRKSRVKERGWVDQTLGRAMTVIDLAKGPAQALGPLKAVLESISIFYTKYQNTVDVKDKVIILCSRITMLVDLFKEPASDDEEEKRREGLLNKLGDIQEKSQLLRDKFALSQFLDSAEDSKVVKGLLEDLQEAVGDYMMMQQMAIYDRGCKHMDAAEQSALDKLRCANGVEFRHGDRKGCLKETREAVLTTIELWAKDPSQSRVYWLNGLAGTGKTTIAKTIAERLFADGELGGSFFCSRDFVDRKILHSIFPTLATQLAFKYKEFRNILVPLIWSDSQIAYESLYNQMNKLIVQPLKKSGISTVIVIDALDECEDEEPASAILSVLGQLASEIPNVKFFLTGRPEPRISQGFRLPLLAKMTDVFVLHNIESSQVDNDIQLFFRHSFVELAVRRGKLDNWPTKEQLDNLCRRAAGLFVYAAATVKFIENNKRDPRSRLDLLLESQKIGAREGKTLDSLYTSILQQAFDDGNPEDDAELRSVLSAVVLAVNPLSPSAIATLLRFKARDVLPLLSSVNSLLIFHVEDASSPARPFHKSFPDFITDPTRCTNKRFHISPPDHHLQLLIGCLDLMNRTLAKNMCRLPDAVANSDVSDLKERTETNIDPALRYACLSWHVHLQAVDTAHAPTITPILHQFLEKKFLFWLEVLSVLGAVRNAIEALQVLPGCMEESSPMLDLAYDCLRFVVGYFELISASAQHIYHSALVFAPQKSTVRKLYESHAHPFTRVVHGLPVSWDANTAATTRPSNISVAAWSPCDRFVAITWDGAMVIDVLDSLTLQRLQTLEFPQEQHICTCDRVLVFSPDSRILTCVNRIYRDQEPSATSWDLQTGGITSVIGQKSHSSPLSRHFHPKASKCTYHPNHDILNVFDIWTHGESLRLAIVRHDALNVLEVGFTPDAKPIVVDILLIPETIREFRTHNLAYQDYWKDFQFLPALCRLAFVFRRQVFVWDVQRRSKTLLHCTDSAFVPAMSFSSDGSFFACSTTASDVYLWKESPTGYILHQILASSAVDSKPLFSRDGELIVMFGGPAIRLWPTKGFTASPCMVSAQTRRRQNTSEFTVNFSPKRMLAVVARQTDHMIMILNLKSSVPLLAIDAGMEVYGLQVIEDAVTIIGDQKVVTWNLPTGYHVPNTNVSRIRTINLRHGQLGQLGPKRCIINASISPDSCYIALARDYMHDRDHMREWVSLHIHCGSTGEELMSTFPWKPPDERGGACWFVPGGHDIWFVGNSSGKGTLFRVDRVREVLQGIERNVDTEGPPEGHPSVSSHGYRVTNDWWILGPDGKRLLMLPPPWQSPMVLLRVWMGQFLALLHGGLPEPVILELNQ